MSKNYFSGQGLNRIIVKNIIITGANGNLGLTVTKKFLEKGYRVIATVIHEDAKMDLGLHNNLQAEVVNLAGEEETNAFAQRVLDKYKKIDAVVMLVGGFAVGNICSTTMQAIRKQISLNFETAYHVARPLFQHMIQNNFGRLIFIGARPALNPETGKGLLAYSLGKSLIFKLADILNEEARGKNVTASVIVPGTIDTAANRKSMPDTNPDEWVKTEQLADVLDFVISEAGSALRETVLKVYNNA
jgi:NAD(P)-dependent dehydrogenase (short-subunit alcohol dehydrogenase family)